MLSTVWSEVSERGLLLRGEGAEGDAVAAPAAAAGTAPARVSWRCRGSSRASPSEEPRSELGGPPRNSAAPSASDRPRPCGGAWTGAVAPSLDAIAVGGRK